MKLDKGNIYRRMSDYNVPGLSLVILENGEFEAVESFGVLQSSADEKVSTGSSFSACSMSKFVTSVLILRLVDEGVLNLDEDVNTMLSTWKIPFSDHLDESAVTLRLLLSHQGGFKDHDNCFSEFKSSIGIPSMLDILSGKTPYQPNEVSVQYTPGSDFIYSDLGFCVIEQIVEDALDMPFKKALEDLVLNPLNMSHSTLNWDFSSAEHKRFACGHDMKGDVLKDKFPVYPYSAAAGLWSTPKDLGLLLLECFQALKGKSKLGISKKTALEMITPQGISQHTGLGVFLDQDDSKIEISSFGWGIGFQCMMVAYPKSESGTVIMTNANLGIHQLKGIIGELFKDISTVYGWD